MAKFDAGNRPGEFGGYPGRDQDIEHGDPVKPDDELRELFRTDSADPQAKPKWGSGGVRAD